MISIISVALLKILFRLEDLIKKKLSPLPGVT